MSSTDRRWLELRARSPVVHERATLLADALVALGGRGVEERRGWFISHFPEPENLDDFIEQARRTLALETGLETILVEHAWQPHQAWEETWKRGLRTRRVAERIVVHPSWLPPEDAAPGDVVITLDPGMAFGTAEHGTTRGCLRLLERAVRQGDRVLDVGAGSGILAIAAARLGASVVVAIEGDGLACEALSDNVQRNGVSASVSVVQEWSTSEAIAARGPVDGIVANIESGLLLPLFEGFAEAVRPEGWLIVSGILAHEWTHVDEELVAAGFRCLDVDADGEWRSGRYELAPA